MDNCATYAHAGSHRQTHGGLQQIYGRPRWFQGVSSCNVKALWLLTFRSGGAANLNDMKDMLASLPQYQEQREKVWRDVSQGS